MGVVDYRLLHRWELGQARQAPQQGADDPTLALLADILDYHVGAARSDDELRESAAVVFLEDR